MKVNTVSENKEVKEMDALNEVINRLIDSGLNRNQATALVAKLLDEEAANFIEMNAEASTDEE